MVDTIMLPMVEMVDTIMLPMVGMVDTIILPTVGMVDTISPSFSLYRMVVFPAPSSPTDDQGHREIIISLTLCAIYIIISNLERRIA